MKYLVDMGLHFPRVAEYDCEKDAIEDNPNAMVTMYTPTRYIQKGINETLRNHKEGNRELAMANSDMVSGVGK